MTYQLIICGSPYQEGRSTHLAQSLVSQMKATPDTEVSLIEISRARVNPCTACDGCKYTFTCVIDDDMNRVYEELDKADELTLVSPVFFSGPPAQLKALLDRLQTYYWAGLRAEQSDERVEQPAVHAESIAHAESVAHAKQKRNAQLFVVREGGDPHGFDPLVTIVKSSLAVAGFDLTKVFDCKDYSVEEKRTSQQFPGCVMVQGETSGD